MVTRARERLLNKTAACWLRSVLLVTYLPATNGEPKSEATHRQS
jgi:hypothetical protein